MTGNRFSLVPGLGSKYMVGPSVVTLGGSYASPFLLTYATLKYISRASFLKYCYVALGLWRLGLNVG